MDLDYTRTGVIDDDSWLLSKAKTSDPKQPLAGMSGTHPGHEKDLRLF
jgi:hypothetical protein